MGNYSIRNIFTKEPVVIAGAVRSVLFVAVLLGAVILDEKQLAGIAIALELGLGLLSRGASTSTAEPKLQEGTAVLNPATPGGDTPPPELVVARVENVIPTVGPTPDTTTVPR
jgi:hypothetical protein